MEKQGAGTVAVSEVPGLFEDDLENVSDYGEDAEELLVDGITYKLLFQEARQCQC